MRVVVGFEVGITWFGTEETSLSQLLHCWCLDDSKLECCGNTKSAIFNFLFTFLLCIGLVMFAVFLISYFILYRCKEIRREKRLLK